MGEDDPRRAKLSALLARTPLFRGLSPEDLEALRAIGRGRALRRGEVLFLEGVPAEGFFLVVAGRVKLYKMSAGGKEQILHVHGPGEVFAEGVLYEGAVYPASAAATEDARVVLFPRRRFQRLLAERPVLATNLIARLGSRLRQLADLVEDLSLKEAPSRLARYLLELPSRQGAGGPVVTLRIPKGELASLLGTRRETLSRLFRKLSDAGLIEVRGSRITVLDPFRLEAIADGEVPGD